MSRLTIAGIIAILSGGIAHLMACPYGIHFMAAGALLTVIGLVMRRPQRPTGPTAAHGYGSVVPFRARIHPTGL